MIGNASSSNTGEAHQASSPHSDVKQIDTDSIKLLAAGEKINDIETAIRELIENSLDAEATYIEIRLGRFGVDLIEVDDNGIGIKQEDFKYLGLRYHTSKISDYLALQESLGTFGFRGEALSCLCNIATVTITTKTKSSPTGWKLVFSKDGTLLKTEPFGRKDGTTVILKNIFHSFPVRRRELEKTAKKQYNKIVRLIYEQVLARPSVKFSLCKKASSKIERDFTHGGTTLEGCLTTIFGVKILETLLPIKQALDSHLLLQLETQKSATLQDSFVTNEEDEIKAGIKPPLIKTPTGNFSVKLEKLETINRENPELISTSLMNTSQAEDEFADGNSSTIQSARVIGTNGCLLQEDEQVAIDAGAQQPNTQPRDEFFRRACRSKYARRKPDYRIHGYISKIGCGRNSSEGQFIFVNGKPCEIPKLTRLINEIYKNYNNNQLSPFYCFYIEVQTWAADFNVPRKRTVILQEESKLCDIARECLEEMYSSYVPASQRSCPMAQIPFAATPRLDSNSVPSQKEVSNVQAAPQVHSDRTETDSDATSTGPNSTSTFHAETFGGNRQVINIPDVRDPVSANLPTNGVPDLQGSPEMGNTLLRKALEPVPAESIVDPFEVGLKRLKRSHASRASSTTGNQETTPEKPFTKSPHFSNITKTTLQPAKNSPPEPLPGFRSGLDILIEEVTPSKQALKSSLITSPSSITSTTPASTTKRSSPSVHGVASSGRKFLPESSSKSSPSTTNRLDVLERCRFRQINAKVNDILQTSIQFPEDLSLALENERIQRKTIPDDKQFSFAIHPKFNVPAEEELKLHLNKKSFKEMEIVGHFNKGFIITRLNKHLFIIDQHATDERANYEEQLENSPLESQAMVLPKPLYLNLIQENAIINNMESFTRRGFEFKIDRSQLVGYRVMLTKTSICKGPTKDEYLDKNDIEELIEVAIESPNRLDSYVLSKVRTVSASIACRKSVMIGDDLTWQQMTNIVQKMSDLKNPWVCAHNRPTIRHLMDLDWISS